MIPPLTRSSSTRTTEETLACEPAIYLISRPVIDTRMLHEFLQDESTEWQRTPNSTGAEEIVEIAGRVCYMSFGNMQSPRSNSEYISNLIRQEHESVLEHISWTFILTGVSRAFTHQLVRHRVGFAFSQLSQQYHDETAVKFVVPEEIKANKQALDSWVGAMEQLRWVYQSMSRSLDSSSKDDITPAKERRRAIRSAARSLLPNAAETKIVVSANARAIRHFLRMRGATIGDIEMRKISALIYSEIHREAPSIIADFELRKYKDGFPVILHHAAPEEPQL